MGEAPRTLRLVPDQSLSFRRDRKVQTALWSLSIEVSAKGEGPGLEGRTMGDPAHDGVGIRRGFLCVKA